jgi:hypothetical protein
VHYRLAAPGVFELSKAIRTVAEDRLADLDRLVREHFADRDETEAVPMGEQLSDRIGRKHVLVAGWIVAVPVPFLLIWAPTWNWILVANVFPGISQGLTWSTR